MRPGCDRRCDAIDERTLHFCYPRLSSASLPPPPPPPPPPPTHPPTPNRHPHTDADVFRVYRAPLEALGANVVPNLRVTCSGRGAGKVYTREPLERDQIAPVAREPQRCGNTAADRVCDPLRGLPENIIERPARPRVPRPGPHRGPSERAGVLQGARGWLVQLCPCCR